MPCTGVNTPGSPPPVSPETATTVLVVDDSAGGLYSKARILTQAGFRVLKAQTGTEALRLVGAHGPALVVLDVRLPDIDGNAVCRTIKGNPASANTMVLQVSAYYTSPEHQVQGLDSGADAYIPGDVGPALLVAAVKALLRTHRAEQAARDGEGRLRLVGELERAQEELRRLASSLINAQEDEQRRIARDLHDDYAQRLAVLGMEVEQLHQELPQDAAGLLTDRLMRIQDTVTTLARDLRNLSHALHPTILEDLGLEAALRNFITSFEQIHAVTVHFGASEPMHHVPTGVATCVFRIAQEALRNAAKYAPGANVTVHLHTTDDGLRLMIRDDGPGFDYEAARRHGGLGLLSMYERASLVGGELIVDSVPSKGTEIHLHIPHAHRKVGTPALI